jgi:Family of unknown function (DUF6364)
MRQKITLALEQDLLRKARVLAAGRGTSVSKMLADELERLVKDEERYKQSMREALADLERGFRLGNRHPRDALHEQ